MVRLKVRVRMPCSGACSCISIPYGSIKSLPLRLVLPQALLFQFLMVRLKVGQQIIFSPTPLTFQFLMVRLKACSWRPARTFPRISIPYGSIKSCRKWDSLYNVCDISIPYGSIKRSNGEEGTYTCGISIPYGSIKSCV